MKEPKYFPFPNNFQKNEIIMYMLVFDMLNKYRRYINKKILLVNVIFY